MRITIETDCRREHVRFVPRLKAVLEQASAYTGVKQCSRRTSRGNTIMGLTMTTTQRASLGIEPVDRLGHKAKLDGPATWLTDNGDIVALTPSADGLTCDIVAVGIPGTCNVQVSGDADLGEGVVTIQGTIEVTITPATAVSITLTPGPVEEQ